MKVDFGIKTKLSVCKMGRRRGGGQEGCEDWGQFRSEKFLSGVTHCFSWFALSPGGAHPIHSNPGRSAWAQSCSVSRARRKKGSF